MYKTIQTTLVMLSALANASALSCLDVNGDAVPSFVTRNLPWANKVFNQRKNGKTTSEVYKPWAFYKIGSRESEFDFKATDDATNALYALQKTQKQWLNPSPPTVQYIAWNSGVADGTTEAGKLGAHDKGFVAWDTKDETGVYLGHTYPEWDAELGPTVERRKRGQHAICISLKGFNEINKVLEMVHTIQPIVKAQNFCDYKFPDQSTSPELSNANEICQSIQTKKWPDSWSTAVVTDTDGKEFTFIAKAHGERPKEEGVRKDIYNIASQELKVDLRVSTWAKLEPRQSKDLRTHVKDLQYCCPDGSTATKYKIPSIDHSKWGYSYQPKETETDDTDETDGTDETDDTDMVAKKWVVLSGSNREKSQHLRGALLIGIQDNSLHKAVSRMYETKECQREDKNLQNLPSDALEPYQKAEAFVGSTKSKKTDLDTRSSEETVVIRGFATENFQIRTQTPNTDATWSIEVTDTGGDVKADVDVLKSEELGGKSAKAVIGLRKPFTVGETVEVTATLKTGGDTAVFKFQLKGVEPEAPPAPEQSDACKRKRCSSKGGEAKRPRLRTRS